MSDNEQNTDQTALMSLRQPDTSTQPSLASTSHTDRQPAHKPCRDPPSPQPSQRDARNESLKGSIIQNYGRDWWSWELTGIATSALSFGAMIAVLLYYDDKPGPKWPWGITVNSILSWTSTIAKSAMLIPVSDGLSQMKWIWFTERDRDLADMDYFEEASRGPYGSLFLLLRLRARHLGTLGAFVTLAALAFDPTVQQLVQHPARIVMAPNKTAVVSASELYGDYEPGHVLSCESSPYPLFNIVY